jgi:hypothetical protein
MGNITIRRGVHNGMSRDDSYAGKQTTGEAACRSFWGEEQRQSKRKAGNRIYQQLERQ